MDVKIQAGATFESISKKEMTDLMTTWASSWVAENARGDHFRRFTGKGTIAAAAVEIGGDVGEPGQRFGPEQGFVWSVMRLAITNFGLDDVYTLHLNSNDQSNIIRPALTPYNAFAAGELVLYPGDKLVIVGSSLVAVGDVWITGGAREYPAQQGWRIQ